MTRKETLDRAMECVMTSRQETHGSCEDSFSLIAKFWSSYLGHEVKDYEVAVCMSLLKIARMQFNPSYDDNAVDGAGYLACAAELVGNRVRTAVTISSVDSPSPLPASVLNPTC